MPITTSGDKQLGSLNGDLSLNSYLLTSLDDDSFVVLERSTADGDVNSTPPQLPPHNQHVSNNSIQFPVFNNTTNSTMTTSRGSHYSEALGYMTAPFDTTNLSVSAQEIDKRLQEVLHENINLKENLYQTNLAMKQQLSTVKLLQDKASETQKNHQAKFEETKILILKLGSEKNDLQEANNLLTAELTKMKEENKELKECIFTCNTEVEKLLSENDILEKQLSDIQGAMKNMTENENKSSLQASSKEGELREVVDQLTKKLEAVERARRQQEFDIERLQAQLGRSTTECNNLQNNLAETKQELELLKNTSHDNLAQVTQELNTTRENLTGVTAELSTANEKVECFTRELNSPRPASDSNIQPSQIALDSTMLKGEKIQRYYLLLHHMEESLQEAATSLTSWVKPNSAKSEEFEIAELRQLLLQEQRQRVARKKTLSDAITAIHELIGDFQVIGQELERVKADHALKESHSYAYDELQKKSFIDRLDTVTAKLVEKDEALAIAERHLASLQEAVRLQNDEKKGDDVQLLKSQVEILSNNIVAKDEELKKSNDLVNTLRSEVQTLTSEVQRLTGAAETSAVLEEQAKIYEADFEAERKSRESLVAEKDRLLEDLRHLQRRNQELIEGLNQHNQRLVVQNIPLQPNNPASRVQERSQSPPPPRPQDEVIPPPSRYYCPNPDCNMMFTMLEPLELHVITCMKLDD